MNPRHLVLVAVLVLTATACGDADGRDRVEVGDPTLRFAPATDASPGTVEVTGLGASFLADLRRREPAVADTDPLLVVRTAASLAEPTVPPVLGTYEVEDDRLVFTPRFPFAAGIAYRALFTPPGGVPVELEFNVPGPDGAGDTRVTAVYPSTATWPMNQLKMYVRFSAPMRPGRAFDYIRLIDEENGQPVEQPFVTVREELWDAERRTLTVLYDPARIKRGLVPNEQAGLPLLEGKSYRLIIDAEWPDATGRALHSGYERRFAVGPLDRAAPHPRDWSLAAPRLDSTDPLIVTFGEPLDHGLLQSQLAVRRASTGQDAAALDGSVETFGDETEWRFTPDAPWAAGRYELVVPTILEDLAGNSLRSLFDHDLEGAPTDFADQEITVLGFRVGAPVSRRQTEAARMPPTIDATNAFYYYADVEAAWRFYSDVLGLRTVADFGFAKILRVAHRSYLTLVDAARGMHSADEPKTATLALVSDEVEGWYDYLRGAGVPMRAEFQPATGRPHVGFVAIDPEGYYLEFERFEPHPENERLLPALADLEPVFADSETNTTRPPELGIRATIHWLYFRDTGLANRFYAATLGTPAIVDQGWAWAYRASDSGFIGIVDGARGLHQATDDKGVTVSLFVDDVDAWLPYLQGIDGFSFRSEEIGDESGRVRTLVGYDPEGYFLEWDTFLDVDGNEELLRRLRRN